MSTSELVARIVDPGWTPPVRALPELLELFQGDDAKSASFAERAVLRIEAQFAARIVGTVVEAARGATRPARGRLTLLAGRLVHEGRDPEGRAVEWLIEALGDADPKTRRAAARGLGNAPREARIEAALGRAWDAAPPGPDREALALAIGKAGDRETRERVGKGGGRAGIIAAREVAREAPSAVVPERRAPRPLAITFHCRRGLEPIVGRELGARFGEVRYEQPGRVEATLRGSLAEALAVRTATHVSFPIGSTPAPGAEDRAAAIVDALLGPTATEIFAAFAEGLVRFRLAFADGGHHRSLVWRCAELARNAGRNLLNDPTASTWEVIVGTEPGELDLAPRPPDLRFAYRGSLVAASSHPTLAAALALVCPRRDDDVVWDPFVGAGLELVERARLGAYARLFGTDLDAAAIAAARENLERAGIPAELALADATTYRPAAAVTAIVSNPPMGRRVQRGRHRDLLERFTTHAGEVLGPGGALVWIVPEPRSIEEAASRAGLWVKESFEVDMGGFSALLSVSVKRSSG